MRVRGLSSVSRVVPVVLTAVALGAPIAPRFVQRVIGPDVALAQPRRLASPVLLKRLAEAVDGYRGGDTVWVVANYDSPYDVVRAYTRESVARDTVRALRGLPWDVFGPYVSSTDPVATRGFIIGCHHYGGSKWRGSYCPEGPVIPIGQIERLELLVRLQSGRVLTLPFSTDVDAMFFSLAAIDKFVIPYYARTLGIEAAAAMRREVVDRATRP